ncbi:MAG: arginine--tRNA ligase, partial [Parcubacteria group bacterium]
MKRIIETGINKTLLDLSWEETDFIVEHPSDLSRGDYSTNVAMLLSKELDRSSVDIAHEIKDKLEGSLEGVERVEVAGPGFINFYLSKEFFGKRLEEILGDTDTFGRRTLLKGEKKIIEYTDPNIFKEFHIGHVMSNTIGEAVSRLLEWNGAEVKRACYQGDTGMHVAQAMWALLKNNSHPTGELFKDAQTLGNAYVEGTKAVEVERDDIRALNKMIHEKADKKVNAMYEEWKKVSLQYFDYFYNILGTKFDYFFFESETGKVGKDIVEKNVGQIFEQSEGAVVFHAESYDPALHTRVFINSEGIPTYEAKELGLAKVKYDKYSYDQSIVVTGNEIKEYFKVILAAMKFVYPELREKTKHLPHGMMRLPTGKMSSRTGDVITANELLGEVKKSIADKGDTAQEEIAVGAIKYMILRQSIGNDIIFDIEKSVSTEGDSGVYLQYAYARATSLVEKASGVKVNLKSEEDTHEVEHL